MSQYNYYSDSESENEYDFQIESDISLSRSVKNKKQSEAGKELKRLEKLRQTRVGKRTATSNALVSQAEELAEQQRLDARSTMKIQTVNTEVLSADDLSLLEARLRQERILDRQGLKKAVQRQRKLKSKNSTQKILRDISKKKAADEKSSVKVQENRTE